MICDVRQVRKKSEFLPLCHSRPERSTELTPKSGIYNCL